MKSRVKMFLPLLMALFLISTVFGISGCGESNSGTNSSQNGASGSGVVYADAKSKSSIEVTYVLQGVGSATPSATITVKNISAETIEFGTSYKAQTYSVQVISIDKAGNSLANEYAFSYLRLQPKEMRSSYGTLFASDETSGCRIVVAYKPVPQIPGTVVDTPSSITVNHFIEAADNDIGCRLVIKVKNNSAEPLGRIFRQNTALVTEHWFYKVSLKDVAGNTLSSDDMILARDEYPPPINPGETRTIYPITGIMNHDLTKANSYEISIYKETYYQ